MFFMIFPDLASGNHRSIKIMDFIDSKFVIRIKRKNEKHNNFTGFSDAGGYRLRSES